MSIKTDMDLAIKVGWLCASKGFTIDETGTVLLKMLDTGVFEITYSLDYPPARVVNGEISFPKGSPQELVWGLFGG